MASWMKAVLISTGFVAVAMHLKVIVPVAVDFSQAPIHLSSFLTWLKPPYLYVITNLIIIVIGVSSRFYRNTVFSQVDGKDYEVSTYSGDYKFQNDHHQTVDGDTLRRRKETKDVDFRFVAATSPSIVVKEPEVLHEEKERPTMVEEEKRCLVVVTKPENQSPVEKPLVTARIGQRKPVVKTSPAERNSVRALRVAKPKRHETLENTWKLITEGKSTLPLTSYYRRPDTFGLGEETKQSGGLRKSETFSDRTNYYDSTPAMPPPLPPLPPMIKVKKVKVSRSRDELNRRVEAFIKKCNDERFASLRLDKEVDRRREISC